MIFMYDVSQVQAAPQKRGGWLLWIIAGIVLLVIVYAGLMAFKNYFFGDNLVIQNFPFPAVVGFFVFVIGITFVGALIPLMQGKG